MGTSNKEHPWLPHCPGDMADILLLSYLRMCCVKGKIVIAAAEKNKQNKQIKRSLTNLLHLYQDIPGRPQPAKHFPWRRLTNFRISFP